MHAFLTPNKMFNCAVKSPALFTTKKSLSCTIIMHMLPVTRHMRAYWQDYCYVLAPTKNKEKEPQKRLRVWYGVSIRYSFRRGIELSTANQPTDTSTPQRGIEILPSSALVSAYTATPVDLYQQRSTNVFCSFDLWEKTFPAEFGVYRVWTDYTPQIFGECDCCATCGVISMPLAVILLNKWTAAATSYPGHSCSDQWPTIERSATTNKVPIATYLS